MKKKKILIATYSLFNGGAEKSLVNFLNEVPVDKYDIDLLLFKPGGMFLKQVPDFVNVLETPESILKLYSPVLQSGNYFFVKLIGTFFSKLLYRDSRSTAFRWHKFYTKKVLPLNDEYDVAIAYTVGEILYFIDEKVFAKKKLVWVHNDYNSIGYPKEYDRPHMENMSKIVSISEKCVDILKKVFPEYAGKCVCLENITSSVVIKRKADEFIPKEYNSKVNILSIGRLCDQKGFDLAIKAASIMKKQKLDFKWYIIGNGELEKKLANLIKQKEVDDCFFLLGTRENPYPYIKNCTIFAQTSRYEGKSVVLDEAKIMGVPILATEYPTVYDQIESNAEGMIVGLNEIDIANGLKKLINSDMLCDKYRNYLKSREYGNKEEVEKYIKVIEE